MTAWKQKTRKNVDRLGSPILRNGTALFIFIKKNGGIPNEKSSCYYGKRQ